MRIFPKLRPNNTLMRSVKNIVSAFSLATMALLLLLSGCKTDECKDAICAPCPSSRLVMEYQDSLGRCLPGFHSSAKVYAIHAENPTDTAYTYNFSDSCHVGFLVDENMVYHVKGSNPTTHDVIYFLGYEYQEPVNVTECCLCYPVLSVNALINSDSVTIDFPAGSYENAPYIRHLN